MKTCYKCHLSKSLVEFARNKESKDGYGGQCLLCLKAYGEDYRRARGAKPYPPFLNRLWDNIQQCHHEDLCPYCCWPWLKGTSKKGYGKLGIRIQGQLVTLMVTRVVYEIWHAHPLLPHQLACHYCDNPPCCNPSHLWIGTANDNIQDAVRKGRHAVGLRTGTHTHPESYMGEKNHMAKLTADDVVHIRALYAEGYSFAHISQFYPVSEFTVRAAVRRRTWKHI